MDTKRLNKATRQGLFRDDSRSVLGREYVVVFGELVGGVVATSIDNTILNTTILTVSILEILLIHLISVLMTRRLLKRREGLSQDECNSLSIFPVAPYVYNREYKESPLVVQFLTKTRYQKSFLIILLKLLMSLLDVVDLVLAIIGLSIEINIGIIINMTFSLCLLLLLFWSLFISVTTVEIKQADRLYQVFTGKDHNEGKRYRESLVGLYLERGFDDVSHESQFNYIKFLRSLSALDYENLKSVNLVLATDCTGVSPKFKDRLVFFDLFTNPMEGYSPLTIPDADLGAYYNSTFDDIDCCPERLVRYNAEPEDYW